MKWFFLVALEGKVMWYFFVVGVFKKSVLIVGVCMTTLSLAASGETSGTSDSGDSQSSDSGSSSGQANPPENDVVISSCSTDSLDSPEAKVKVTNNSSKASNYIIEIAFESPDGSTQIDTSTVFINDLQPGQTATEKAISFADAPADFTCRITDVTRFAA